MIDLHRSVTNPSTEGGDQLASTIVSLCEDMIVMGDVIVVGVAHVSEENEEIDNDTSIISSSKRKAPYGAVGNSIDNRRKSSK